MITRVCYTSRSEMQRAVQFQDGVDQDAAADRANESAADNIDAQLHRRFYPNDVTRYFDWPNQGGSGGGQYADPWRLWFDQYDVVVLTALNSGGTSIPLNQVFLEPVNREEWEPAEYLELDRSSTAAFGSGLTPQHSISLGGTFGYSADADQVATLAADVGSGDLTVTVSDGSQAGPGNLLVLGYGRGQAPYPAAYGYAGALQPFTGERVLITDVAFADTGLAQSGSGCSSASTSDQALTTTGTGSLNKGEVVLADQEQMLVEQIVAGVATVRRAWNGTTLAEHSSAEIYALRLYSVLRGQLGTTAASYTSGAAVFRHRVPPLVRDLSIAEGINQVLQEGTGYARTVGTGDAAYPAPGQDLASKWDEAMTAHGRKARQRAV